MASNSIVSVDSDDSNGSEEGSSLYEDESEESGGSSPGRVRGSGSDSALIRIEVEKKLEVGSVLDSLDLNQIYLLYSEYARCSGFRFSVRKGWQRCFPDSIDVRTKVYRCSCEGRAEAKLDVGRLSRFNQHVTRSDCKAQLRVDRELDGPWTVSVFDKDHSHKLLLQDPRYFLHLAPNLSDTRMAVQEALDSAGIGRGRARGVTEKPSGGTSRVRKHTKLDVGDLVWVPEFLSNKSNKELFFYWDVQFDDDGKLMNFFFRDYRCLVDYEFFGDVLCIDTTYRVNGNGLICVPFMGGNNHRNLVMFGLAFLSDETTESFEWLLKTFMKSMHKKEPQVVFTDHCRALMNSVGCAFQTASHRLCQRHITRNAESQANWNDELKGTWHRCMNGCETEAEFENSWSVLIEALGRSDRASFDDTWFTNMYDLRRRWASVFTDGQFSAGLRSTLPYENLVGICLSTDSLHKFLHRYQQLLADWRAREAEDDASPLPEQLVENNKLLDHAARVYTREVYEVFQREALYTLNVDIIGLRKALSTLNVDIIRLPERHISGEDEDAEFDLLSDSRTRRVRFNKHTSRATCTCRKWETEGFLCRHILKIYYSMSVERLPEECIVKRWTRDARASDVKAYADGMEGDVQVMYITRVFYDTLLTSEGNTKAISFLCQQINSLQEEVKDILTTDDGNENANSIPSSKSGMCVKQEKGKRKLEDI